MTKKIKEFDQRGNEVEFNLMEHAVHHNHHELASVLLEQGFVIEDKEKLKGLIRKNDVKMKEILGF